MGGHRTALALAFSLSLAIGCAPAGEGMSLGETDSRCTTLCQHADPSCSADVMRCEPACQVHVAGLSPLCATCLLEGASRGPCTIGSVCCPRPSYAAGPLDCAAACEGSVGVNVASHPLCDVLCTSDDASCDAAVASCLADCNARVRGVSGLCALCLLDGAHGGPCTIGSTCCPDPTYPTSAADCASVCG